MSLKVLCKFSLTRTNKSKSIQLFFKKVFTQSEGKKEGNLVSKLSFKLAKLIDGENVIGIEAKIKTILKFPLKRILIFELLAFGLRQ